MNAVERADLIESDIEVDYLLDVRNRQGGASASRPEGRLDGVGADGQPEFELAESVHRRGADHRGSQENLNRGSGGIGGRSSVDVARNRRRSSAPLRSHQHRADINKPAHGAAGRIEEAREVTRCGHSALQAKENAEGRSAVGDVGNTESPVRRARGASTSNGVISTTHW